MAFEKDMEKAKERARNIKLFAHDVHGVLTPNTVLCDVEGRRQYTFWHMDGFGDLSLSANEIRVAFIDTTSIDGEGLFRAKELKLDKFYYPTKSKIEKLKELKAEMGITDSEIGFIGCEITDIGAMKMVGFAVATSDAIDEVKEIAHYITAAPGGRGAIREVAEFILRAMGKWDVWVDKVTKMGYK
ncbi:MAG: HAD hydrolase family protein [Syntrophorhabdaceae bacterium]|nr:HAD hydrolase family protein [Syntrophorhabdaceae bacterium]